MRGEAGGLSGKPLFERSTIVLAKMRQAARPESALIGVGGVDSAETALEKIRAGADLVQLYTGMIYAGPGAARPRSCAAWTSTLTSATAVSQHRDLRDSRARLTGPTSRSTDAQRRHEG